MLGEEGVIDPRLLSRQVLAGMDEFLHILGDQVILQIHAVPGFFLTQSGLLGCMGNDARAELLTPAFEYGQADAVNGHGPLLDQEPADLRRNPEAVDDGVAVSCWSQDV